MAERFEIVQKALIKMLDEKKYITLRDILVTMYPSDIAQIFAELEENQIPLMFRLLTKEQAAETFVEMDPDAQELLIKGFSDNELKEVLDELYVDDAADIVEEMPANVVKRILKAADPEMRKSINQILRYPEDSAGSIMTTEYVSLRPNMTVEEAILRIRRQGVDKETIYTCYVTGNDRTLLGLVSVKDLLLAEDDEMRIKEIMTTNVISVSTQTDQESVARMLSKYNFLCLPVVDGEQRMVGIVTFDDAMDVLMEEATEDMELMSGMTPSEKPYLKSSTWELFKNRFPWLTILMVSSTFTGLIITSFEDALSKVVALTAFIPMLMGTGGNSGSQSSVTVIRALSLDELRFSDLPRVIAEKNGCASFSTFTGFKYMAEKVAQLEQEGKYHYVLAYEESYGYMIGDHARDKDGVVGALLLCEMAAWYRSRGMTVLEGLEELLQIYGAYGEVTRSVMLPGEDGSLRMARIMAQLRQQPPAEWDGIPVESWVDYEPGRCYRGDSVTVLELQGSNVLEYRLATGEKLIVRPSGTEPKIKIYALMQSVTAEQADDRAAHCAKAAEDLLLRL